MSADPTDDMFDEPDMAFSDAPLLPGERLLKDVPTPTALIARLPSSFAFVPSSHESVLIGNRWLSRGDGAILVSTSGMGKSSLGFELAADWALGLDFHGGLKPRVPLKTLIVQSEDGDGDVAEVYHSYCHAKRLSPAQTRALDANLRILTDRVHRGQSLVTELKRHILSFAPDIIIINPLLAFIDGDLNSAEDAGRFLREQLNSLNEPARFAYLVIHHTSKPPKEKTERRWNEVMYDMAGSGDLTNWARAILSLRPCKKEGQFELSLSKRGRRAGFTQTVAQGVGTRQDPATKIGLKHSTESFTPPGSDHPIPLIHWEACELEADDDKPNKPAGRPEKHLFETYFAVFPPKASQGKTLAQLWMALKDNGPIPKNSLHDICTRWKEQGDVEIIETDGSPRRYRRTL